MTYYPERTLFDDFFNNGFAGNGLMRTDIAKKDGMYTLSIELPGYKKEDVKISLYNGELKVTASRNETKDEKDARGDLVRSERYNGTVSRSFYVGDTIRDTDIHASYADGILTVKVPTAEKKEAEGKKFISIE